jgi:hypothetical protein
MSPRSPVSPWDGSKVQKSPNIKSPVITKHTGNQGVKSSKEQKQATSHRSPAGSVQTQASSQVSVNNRTPEKEFPGLVPQKNLNNNIPGGTSSPSLRDIMQEEQSKISREKR